jgi:hypothetical protein
MAKAGIITKDRLVVMAAGSSGKSEKGNFDLKKHRYCQQHAAYSYTGEPRYKPLSPEINSSDFCSASN